jgi:hypothetical protein
MAEENIKTPFAIKDCALISIATGKRAQNLKEMRDILQTIHPGSVYHHFWGALLKPRFDDPQYNNDFAVWVHYALHDDILAERLAVIDPTDFEQLEDLRQNLLDIIENRLDEIERLNWAKPDQQFHFTRSQIVVFDTDKKIFRPDELAEAVKKISVGSVFYHFIDARRREPWGIDDFRYWIEGFGEQYQPLCDALASVDPYFLTLTELREQLITVFSDYFGRAHQ